VSYTGGQDQVTSMTYIKYRCLISSAVDQVSNITYQVSVSDIKCRGLGIKYNISSVGAINHASSITCQVSGKYRVQTCIASNHVLKFIVASIRHVTVVIRCPHINIML